MPKKGVKSRGNGQGCAVKERGTWKAIAVVGYKEDGKPIRRVKRGFLTKREALEYIPTLRETKVEKEKAPITLIEAEREWLKTLTISESTIDCYKAGLKIFEELCGKPLVELGIDELQECMDFSEKKKRTQQNAKIALGLVYKWAIPRGHIPNNLNIASFLKVRADDTSTPRLAFTDEQLAIIKQAIPRIPIARIIYCHCYLGFRPSALLELTCEDYWPEGKYFKGGIKTEAGKNRIVTISPKIQPYVTELVAESEGLYIFSNHGEKLTLDSYRAKFYACMEELGFQRPGQHTYSPHSCRHTFATLMKRIDAPEKDKLELIGHTEGAMLRYYQDVDLRDLRGITDRL